MYFQLSGSGATAVVQRESLGGVLGVGSVSDHLFIRITLSDMEHLSLAWSSGVQNLVIAI